MRFCPDLLLTSLALSLCGLMQAGTVPEARAADNLTPAQEFVTTSPIIADGVLYIASFCRPEHAGHLRAIDITGSTPLQLWDAAEQMPKPGTGASPGFLTSSDPPQTIDPDNQYRTLFTNLATRGVEHLQPVAPSAALALQTALGATTAGEAQALINSIRGRTSTSAELVDGSGDAFPLLWGISRSTPAVAGRSFLAENASERIQVVYVGAEDGMLHAFYAGSWDTLSGSYNQSHPVAGQELWAYLPGSLLPCFKYQPFDDSSDEIAVHVDGAPTLGDFFLDWNGDGRRQWRTLLVGTGSTPNLGRSAIFALDVTDPYQPMILWEQILLGTNLGMTRGAVIGDPDDGLPSPAIFLTTSYANKTDQGGTIDPVNGEYGLQACAIDLLTGNLRWQWQSRYDGPAADINTTPAQPALMDVDGNGSTEYLIFGDMAGRLWAIDAATGAALGGVPVYTVAGGATQPIGAGVATHGRLAIFGTGGAEHADEDETYAIYAVEILPTGGQLLWTHILDPGEKVWNTPAIDQFGRVYFAASADYQPEEWKDQTTSTGRLVILDKTGQQQTSTSTDSAVPGKVQIGPDLAVAVSLSGQVYQFGSAQRTVDPDEQTAGSVRLFSWRVR